MVKPCMLPFKYDGKTMNMCITFYTIRITGSICPIEKPNGTWFQEDLWGYCLLKPRGNCDQTDGKYQRFVMSLYRYLKILSSIASFSKLFIHISFHLGKEKTTTAANIVTTNSGNFFEQLFRKNLSI